MYWTFMIPSTGKCVYHITTPYLLLERSKSNVSPRNPRPKRRQVVAYFFKFFSDGRPELTKRMKYPARSPSLTRLFPVSFVPTALLINHFPTYPKTQKWLRYSVYHLLSAISFAKTRTGLLINLLINFSNDCERDERKKCIRRHFVIWFRNHLQYQSALVD